MKKAPLEQTAHPFLESYRRNFLSFLEVSLSVLPIIVLGVCGLSLGAFIFSQKLKYLFVFVGTLLGAPLLQTISEHLESFFAKQTREK